MGVLESPEVLKGLSFVVKPGQSCGVLAKSGVEQLWWVKDLVILVLFLPFLKSSLCCLGSYFSRNLKQIQVIYVGWVFGCDGWYRGCFWGLGLLGFGIWGLV